MKKEPLSIIIVKTLLAVIIFTGLGTIIIGGAYLISMPKAGLPVVDPVIKTQCEIDLDCQLVFNGKGCSPCSTSAEEWQCLPQKEAIEARMEYQRRIQDPKGLQCAMCMPPFKPQHICKCENGKCEKVKEESKEEVSITTDKTEYKKGEIVKITIENNSDKEQKMDFPIYSVEKSENDEWIRIKQVYCPCGAACNMAGSPPIESRSKLKFEWDQQESWCDDSIAVIYSKKISVQVSAGIYRIKSVKRDMDGTNDDQPIYSNKFTIKEKSALDPRCGEKVRGIGMCEAYSEGYEFNMETGKCIERGASGCSFEIPFKILEECQEVCEKTDLSCSVACSKILPSANAVEISSFELAGGMYYGNLDQKKKGTPTDWVHTLEGTKSSSWRSLENGKSYKCDCN